MFARLLAAAGFLLPAHAAADGWGYLYGAVKLTSDYRFHGVSESNRQPTLQGNLHWVSPDGWYLGIFSSGVDFRDGSTNYEIDWYGGRHVALGGDDLNLEFLYYTFPDKAGPTPTYDAAQGSAELTHSVGELKLAGKLALKYPHAGLAYEGDASASYPLTSWLSANGAVGYQDGEKSFGRANWEIGMTASSEHWVLDLRYSGTNIDRAHCYFTNWCETGFGATVTYQFGFTL
jgi:uncharacterized protein (TIGR02001 family)